MHDDSAGKIHHPPGGHNAVAPHPMGNRRIDQQKPEGLKPKNCRKFHVLDISTNDQGWCNDGKGHLEGSENGLWNAARDTVKIQPGQALAGFCAGGDGGKIADTTTTGTSITVACT